MEQSKPEQNSVEMKFDFYGMITLTQSLIEIILQEGDFLRDAKISEIVKFQPQKHEIAAKLETQQKLLKENESTQLSLTAEQIQLLRKLAKDYDEAIIYYQAQLFKAQKVNELTVKMITDTIVEYANRNRGYNDLFSAKKLHGSNYVATAPAIKLNKNI